MTPKQHCFSLDGLDVRFSDGDTIMQAASKAGIHIPHLCFHPDYPAQGSCRLCSVKIQGKTVAACTQPAVSGQAVESNTADLNHSRLRLIQLLFAEGNHFCPTCEASGNCELQALAYDLGMTHYHYAPFNQARSQDASHPELFIDRDRCIQCDLCTRASITGDHKNVFGLSGRGEFRHLIVRSGSGLLSDSDAHAADHAAQICPVGCILPKSGNYGQPIGQRCYDQPPIHSKVNQADNINNQDPPS